MSMVTYNANIKNTCGYPIRVLASDEFGAIELNQVLNEGEAVNVLPYFICSGTRGIFTIEAFVSTINELERCLPKSYVLEISADNNQITLDKTQFLSVLRRSESISSANFAVYDFEISDPSLCPK
ncbi:MAG: hypothetical protein LBD38_01365 [Streptococcaceae bacterium]|nr:hypothetical protein [Streptococcaceae bacterium]